MKMSISKQNLLAAIGGALVVTLALASWLTRTGYENSIDQVDAFRKAVVMPVSEARTAHRNLTPESDAATIEKEIVAPLQTAKNELQNLYEGKSETLQISLKGSERNLFTVKLIMIELERTIGEIKNKAAAIDFDRALEELDKLVVQFDDEIRAQKSIMEVTSWLTVMVSFLVFCGLAVWKYIGDRRVRIDEAKLNNQISKEQQRVRTLSDFIEAMATGNYSIELAIDSKDELSTTLVTMRDKLKQNAEEDQRRNWATSGLAQIGEILRATSQTSAELYDNIVRFVVKYTKSNQAGLFIINDDDSQNHQLELVACYAFERKKFLTKRIDIGQGLVGQCYLERERIHLREIPSDYVRITSGLGGENPTSCLLVPLKVNEQVFGVLELASFKHYEDFEIELVEKLAESIASTISSVRINESTRLLLERTQQQAEEMKSQEEEMRQNMEELSATQEEMQRKEREYIQRIQELEEQQAVLAK